VLFRLSPLAYDRAMQLLGEHACVLQHVSAHVSTVSRHLRSCLPRALVPFSRLQRTQIRMVDLRAANSATFLARARVYFLLPKFVL
jgi:hypothetical protein